MKLMGLIPAALLGLAATVAPGSGRCAEVDELLPEETLLLVRVRDREALAKAWPDTAAGKIAAEEEVAAYLAGARRVFTELAARIEKAGGVSRAEFGKAYPAELAVAVLSLDAAASDIGPAPAWVILAGIGDAGAAERAEAAVGRMLGGGKRREKLPWPDVEAFRLKAALPGATAGIWSLRAGGRQAWVFARSEARARDLAAAMAAGRSPRPLAAAPAYALARRHLGAAGDILVYSGMAPYLKQVGDSLPAGEREGFARIAKAAGLSDLDAVAWSMKVEPPGFRTRMFTAFRPAETGPFALIGTGPVPPGTLKSIPAGASTVSAGELRAEQAVPAIRAVFTAIDEKRGARDLDRFLKEFKRELGFDLEAELLGSLGRRYCLFAMPPGAGAGALPLPIPDPVLVWEIKDAEGAKRLRAAAETLMKAANAHAGAGEEGTISSFDYRGQKVYSLAAPAGITPGWTVTDKHLVLAVNVATLKRSLVQLAGGEGAGEGLPGDKPFAAAAGRVKIDGACAVVYHDLAKDLGVALGGLGLAGNELRREVSRSLERLRRTGPGDAMSRLSALVQACQLWAEEHEGAYPPDLGALVPDYLEEPAMLRSPDCAGPADGATDWGYFAGLRSDDKRDCAVVYETAPAADGTVNAAFADGRVQNLTLEALRKQLAAQAAVLAAAGRKGSSVEPQGVVRGTPPPEIRPAELGLELLAELLDTTKLPPAEGISKHLFPSLTATRRVEGGLLSESFSPTPVATGWDVNTAITGWTVGVALAAPLISRARGGALMAASKSNLRQIGLACHMYADDNDEVFPDKGLGQLAPVYVDNKKIFQCPHYARHAKDGIDYAYVAGLKAADSGETIMAYEVRPGPGRKVNVLFADAHVEALSAPELRRRLGLQMKRLKTDGRKVSLVEPEGIEEPPPKAQ